MHSYVGKIRYETDGVTKEHRYFQAENFLTRSEYNPDKIEILNTHNEILERYY
jgi:hypothetical protein